MKMKSLVDGAVVGEGLVVGMYGKDIWRGSLINPPYARVYVEKVVNPEAELPVTHVGHRKLGDANQAECLWHVKGLKRVLLKD